MERDIELDRLKHIQDQAFQRQQDTFYTMRRKQEKQHMLSKKQQSVWIRHKTARDEMKREYERLQADQVQNNVIWSTYWQIRDLNNARIGLLIPQANNAFKCMVSDSDSSSKAYSRGDEVLGAKYLSSSRQHKAIMRELKAEIRQLGKEVNKAKLKAQSMKRETDSSAYQSAKARFWSTKNEHESIYAEFKFAQAEYFSAKTEFVVAKAEYREAKEAFETLLNDTSTKE